MARLIDADELIRTMKERDDDNGGEPLNAVDRGYHLCFEHMCKEIEQIDKIEIPPRGILLSNRRSRQ